MERVEPERDPLSPPQHPFSTALGDALAQRECVHVFIEQPPLRRQEYTHHILLCWLLEQREFRAVQWLTASARGARDLMGELDRLFKARGDARVLEMHDSRGQLMVRDAGNVRWHFMFTATKNGRALRGPGAAVGLVIVERVHPPVWQALLEAGESKFLWLDTVPTEEKTKEMTQCSVTLVL